MSVPPLIFVSYAQFDDDHEGGALRRFRDELSRTLQFVSGDEMGIFQGGTDVEIGQQVQERISQSLNEAIVLVPVLTPSFFTDPTCRDILTRFLERERQLGRNDLVLPVYYQRVPKREQARESTDPLLQAVAQRQMLNWQPLRGKDFNDSQVRQTLERLATRIAALVEELQTISGTDDTRRLSKRFINRREELRTFEHLLAFSDAKRIMVMHDKAGTGKSFLLRHFQHIARQRNIPVCLVNLEGIHSPLSLVESIYQELMDDHPTLAFRTYEPLRQPNPQPWDEMVKRDQMRRADDKSVPDSRSASGYRLGDVPSAASDERATLRAFWRDLQQICQAQPLILLLDQYEELPEKVKEWLRERFVRNLALTPEPTRHRLLFVIAGREPPDLATVASEQHYQERVHDITRLSRWTREDIQDCMQLYGVTPDPRTVEMLHEQAQKGMHTLAIVTFIQAYQSAPS